MKEKTKKYIVTTESDSPLRQTMVDMTIQEWIDLFTEANEMLRSTYAIALRKGKDTNWSPFTKTLKTLLDKHHKLLHPKYNGTARKAKK